MKNILQEIKDCSSVRINCCLCGAGERVYFIPESIISKLEVVVAKMETTTPTCKDSLQVGNIAAMREALVQCELFLGNVSRHGHPTLNPGDKCTACDGADELRGMVARALSDPARNCDRFGGDPKMLYAAWFDRTASPNGMNDDGTVKLTYGEWLLERANGGAHANR